MERVRSDDSGGVTGTNTRRIRFAAPPTGELRWQMPHVPSINRTLANATKFGDVCPQIPNPGNPYMPAADESEDCLFVNVYAPPPPRGKKLPVMIWIHGGGYKHGNGRYDLSEFITKNGNSIIGVQIQYRVRHSTTNKLYACAANQVYKAGCFWFPLLVRGRRQGSRQRRTPRPDIGAVLGTKVHKLLRRRPGASNDSGTVGWRWFRHVSCLG
jgi:carboxylesterase family protein